MSKDGKVSMISLAAVDQCLGLGVENKLLIHLPLDLQRFKLLTINQTVLMGRKTYESIGHALPKRHNIVLTRQQKLSLPDCACVNDFDQALALCQTDKLFIIGGGEIYQQSMALGIVDQLLLTFIHHRFEQADTFFPPIDEKQWQITDVKLHPADKRHAYPFSFVTYDPV